MWQYQNTDELYHYGILGMKWGRRKTVPAVNRKLYEQRNMSPAELKKVQAKAALKAANKQYSKDYNKAYNYSARHPITQWGGKGKKESDSRWSKAYDSAKAANKAKTDYKKAKVGVKKERVKNYLDEKKKADSYYKQGDKEMKKAQTLYKKTGKNALSRIFNNAVGKSDAVKIYTKQFNKASSIYDKGDEHYLKAEKAYKKTGVNNFARKRNVKRYSK